MSSAGRSTQRVMCRPDAGCSTPFGRTLSSPAGRELRRVPTSCSVLDHRPSRCLTGPALHSHTCPGNRMSPTGLGTIFLQGKTSPFSSSSATTFEMEAGSGALSADSHLPQRLDVKEGWWGRGDWLALLRGAFSRLSGRSNARPHALSGCISPS